MVFELIFDLERSDGDQLVIPIDYCDIAFETWLDMFLEYALVIAHNGDIESAYGIIASAYHANVFYHSPNLLLLINVCWFSKHLGVQAGLLADTVAACALIGDDDETLCNIARWFMKEYQYVTDGYRLFSALNRLCNSESSWFNCGPSQKYIMRQLKAVDFSILAEDRRKSLFQERASYSTKTSDGLKLQAGDMDIALLMLYGHILHAGRSYANAVSKFTTASTMALSAAVDTC